MYWCANVHFVCKINTLVIWTN